MYIHDISVNYLYDNLNRFYSKQPICFKDITLKRINELKNKSQIANKALKSNKMNAKANNYILFINNLRIHSEDFGIKNEAEKLILFMFSVDPTFEAIKIVGECNRMSEIKIKMIKHFGLYDLNLIKIEKYFIKHFLSQEQKKSIDDEIEKRAFK